MLRFCSLASGSRGNALLVESAAACLLLDCGLSLRELTARMQAVGRHPDDLSAILVTHEHSDHVSGLESVSRAVDATVWMTHGTAHATGFSGPCNVVRPDQAFTVGDVTVSPFPVPHDAREPAHYRFAAAGRSLGVLTDTGHITAHIRASLAGCDALALEFNHDLDALMSGFYPAALKARVGSDYGHLNNRQAAELLGLFEPATLQWLVALHLSEKNNTPALVANAIRSAGDFSFSLAEQGQPGPWQEIE